MSVSRHRRQCRYREGDVIRQYGAHVARRGGAAGDFVVLES